MNWNKKPRLAEVLGVEVGEKFDVDGRIFSPYMVTDKGFVIDREGEIDYEVVTYLLNDLSRLVRRPRWTEQEVEDAKVIARLIPTVTAIRRLVTNSLSIVDPFDDVIVEIYSERFPSIPAGKGAYINDIIGGNE